MQTVNHLLKVALMFCAALPALAATASLANEPVSGLSGEIAIKSVYFDYTDGSGNALPQYLERYNVQKGWNGNDRSGAYLDLDLDLVYAEGTRDLFTLERRGDGRYNHAGKARYNAGMVGVAGYYNHFRTATNGIEYLYNPNLVPLGVDPSYTGNTYFRQFNNDSPGEQEYQVDRTTYGIGLTLKPELFGNSSSVNLKYDGYVRDGDRFTPYILGGSDARNAANTANATTQRWRGFAQPVDDKMDRVSLNVAASPGDILQLAYDFSVERFDNQARNYQHSDIVFPPGTIYNPANDATRPLTFVPDSNLVTHALRLTKDFGSTAVAGGYSIATLEQDSFTVPQNQLGYTDGEFRTDNGFLTVNHLFSPQLAIEAFLKYKNRDNDSTYPVANLIDPTDNGNLAVRIDEIKTLEYGLSASYRATGLKTTFTPGWRHVDTKRDLTFNEIGITDAVSLYDEDSEFDEVYLKMVARPVAGLTLRITPSYLWASETGLVSEPEEALKIKTQVSYALTASTLLNGYYNYENRQNNENTFTDKVAPNATYKQDLDNTLQSAGLSVSMVPVDKVNTYVSFDWSNNAFEVDYFSTDRRRFEATPVFAIRDRSEYDVDTCQLSIGGDWQASQLLNLNGTYTFSKSKGDVASGLIARELEPTIAETIDNTLHSFAVGADYTLREGLQIRPSYAYDYYSDDAYGDLSGGVHTVVVSLAMAF